MSDVKVYFFPKTGSDKILGGGYVHTAHFNVSYTVFKPRDDGGKPRISWPSHKTPDGKWIDDAKPVTKAASEQLEAAILEKMNADTDSDSSSSQKSSYATSNPYASSAPSKDSGIPIKPPF